MMARSEFFRNKSWNEYVTENYKDITKQNPIELINKKEETHLSFRLIEETMTLKNGNTLTVLRHLSALCSDYLDTEDLSVVDVDYLNSLVSFSRNIGKDILLLSNIPEDSPLYLPIHEYVSKDEYAHIIKSPPTLGVRIEASFDNYILSLSRNTKRDIKRKNILVKKMGLTPSIEPINRENLEKLLALQAERAKIKGMTIFAENDHLLSSTLRQLEQNDQVTIATLKDGEKTISSLLLLHDLKTIGIYMQGFDQQYSEVSPSFILFMETIRYAFENGYKYVDFLRGDEIYKKRLANNEIQMCKFLVFLSEKARNDYPINFFKELIE